MNSFHNLHTGKNIAESGLTLEKTEYTDFYMLNDHTLGFLIADVSGKSIPGAMFMMTSKTVIIR